MTEGCSVVGTDPIPRARAASIRFCTAGMTESAGASWTASANTMHGTSPIASARPAAGWNPRGRSSNTRNPSSWRFAHQAARYSAPNSRIVSGSFTTRKRAGCRLPPLGALTAASRMSSRSAGGIGSRLNRRIARCVNMASPSGIDSRLASTGRPSAREVAVAAPIEDERAVVAEDPELLHVADDDEVVAAVVLVPDRAVDVRQRVVQDRRPTGRASPADAAEPVGALRREHPADVLLVLVEDVHREFARGLDLR